MTYTADHAPTGALRFREAGAWWVTVPAERRVLVMAATAASTKRLVDIAALFEGDLRVQLHFTVPPNPFDRGAAQMLRGLGAPLLAWNAATRSTYDLAVTANLHGIEHVSAPVAVFSHGASRNSLARPRGRGALPAVGPVIGFSRAELISDGMLVPSSLALGHTRELELLAEGCPEAVPVADVVGDPCADRLARDGHLRERYRRALGLQPGQKLVVVTSTWRPNSLFGSNHQLIGRLVEQLPADEYRIALLTHPNIWAEHGEYQMRSWLAPWTRRGLHALSPYGDWQPLLLAADHLIGDHGSVTLYGACLGIPVLLGAFPDPDVHPDSGAALLARTAPRIDTATPLPEQLERATATRDNAALARAATTISSLPGQFAATTRTLLYRLMGLDEPGTAARLARAADPAPLRPHQARHKARL